MPERNHLIFVRLILIFAFLLLNQIRSNAQITKADSVLKKTESFIRNFLFQRHDTAYISNYSDELALKILGVTKYTFFQLNDKNRDSHLRYRPARQLNLGFGVAYQWFAIDVAFNVGIREQTSLDNSKFIDFQGRIFSRKQYVEATYQYYYGYSVNTIKTNTPILESSRFRNDIRTNNFVLQYLYVFNHGKFSLKAPFVLNEVQKKSAGSFIGGVNFSIYIIDADSSMVPAELAAEFAPELHIRDLNVTSLGVNVGYMYSLIWKKKVFFTLSFIPGVSLNMGDYLVDFRQPLDTHLSFRLRTMNAIGYNGRKIFTGIQAAGNLINVKLIKGSNVEISHGYSKFFIGYRFASNQK